MAEFISFLTSSTTWSWNFRLSSLIASKSLPQLAAFSYTPLTYILSCNSAVQYLMLITRLNLMEAARTLSSSSFCSNHSAVACLALDLLQDQIIVEHADGAKIVKQHHSTLLGRSKVRV